MPNNNNKFLYINIFSFFVFVCLLTLSCGKKNNIQKQQNIESASTEISTRSIHDISVLYYNYIFTADSLISPANLQMKIPQFDIDRKGILDAQIIDSLQFNKIEILLRALQNSDIQNPLDARIVATITYNDQTKDVLCIGGEYSDRIYVNGMEKKTNNELLYLIKNYIGFYPWMIGDDMFQMREMEDSSFPKEPFISSRYYKDYQEVLANK